MSFDAGNILASLLIGAVGFVAFSYGRRQSRPPQMAVGLLLMVFPYFVSSVLLMVVIAAALVALLWLSIRLGW